MSDQLDDGTKSVLVDRLTDDLLEVVTFALGKPKETDWLRDQIHQRIEAAAFAKADDGKWEPKDKP